MCRFLMAVVACLSWIGLASVVSRAEPSEAPTLLMHLVATYEYPSCSEMTPASAEDVVTALTREDLTRSKGFGYICFLVGGVEGLTGVEFALEGVTGVPGMKAGAIEWCAPGALQMGDFQQAGGIAAFPCFRRIEGNEFVHVGYLPFEYLGETDLEVRYTPSAFSKIDDPQCYILECSSHYTEHRVVEMSGCEIEAFTVAGRDSRRVLQRGRLIWAVDAGGTLQINRVVALGPAYEFPVPLVPLGGTVLRVNAEGDIQGTLEGCGVRWILTSRDGRRLLRCSRADVRGSPDLEPWDLELVDASGEVLWKMPGAGQRGWISPDGSRVAWQRVAHAGRFVEGFHLWAEGSGEIEVPQLGVRDAGFLADGTFIGWGEALGPGAAGGVEEGEWGVFALEKTGRVRWWVPVREAKRATLSVSEGGVALVGVRPGTGVRVEGWDLSGDARFSRNIFPAEESGTVCSRVAAALSGDGRYLAVAWSSVSGEAFGAALFDGKTGREKWRREAFQDFREETAAPDRVVFSGDGERMGVLWVRMSGSPVYGVSLYTCEDGNLIWRRKRTRCAWQDRDLVLSELGDRVLLIACGQAHLYEIVPERSR